MAIRNRIFAFIYRIILLGFAVAALVFLVLDEEENGNYFESVLYFDTEITLFAAAILTAEIIANGIGLSKGANGLAPGVWSPLSLASVALEATDLFAYPSSVALVGGAYFPSHAVTAIVFAHIVFPLLFISDWILFGEKGTVKWVTVLYWLIYPVLFFLFQLTRHSISGDATITCPIFDTSEFASNASVPSWFAGNGGWNGVVFSSFAMLGLFVSVSYLLLFFNNLMAGKYFPKKPLVQ